jgi:hypothetical protein
MASIVPQWKPEMLQGAEEVTTNCRKLHNEELRDLYLLKILG